MNKNTGSSSSGDSEEAAAAHKAIFDLADGLREKDRKTPADRLDKYKRRKR